MKSNKRPISAPILILLSFAILLGNNPQVYPSSKRIEDPSFWISKIKNPDRLLMTLSEIREMNEENLKKQDILLCRVEDLREEWTREEIRTFLKEYWEGFGKTGEIRYGRDGIPLGALEGKTIGEVVVTDLNLGEQGPNGSLLQRLTEIQFVGPGSEVNK